MSNEQVEFACKNCGTKLAVPVAFAGRTAPCPSCNQTFIVPGREPDPPEAKIPCPYCGEQIQKRAMLCRFCKTNLSTGTPMKAPPDPDPPAKKSGWKGVTSDWFTSALIGVILGTACMMVSGQLFDHITRTSSKGWGMFVYFLIAMPAGGILGGITFSFPSRTAVALFIQTILVAAAGLALGMLFADGERSSRVPGILLSMIVPLLALPLVNFVAGYSREHRDWRGFNLLLGVFVGAFASLIGIACLIRFSGATKLELDLPAKFLLWGGPGALLGGLLFAIPPRTARSFMIRTAVLAVPVVIVAWIASFASRDSNLIGMILSLLLPLAAVSAAGFLVEVLWGGTRRT